MATKRAILVYQGGIANVIETEDGQRTRRIMQHAFGPCEWFVKGYQEAGGEFDVAYCAKAGDAMHHSWKYGLDALEEVPFREGMSPPLQKAPTNHS